MSIWDVWSMVRYLRSRKNKHLAMMLDELEAILPDEGKEYELVRKLLLDHFNDYFRTVFRAVLGVDVEGQDYL